jgi:HD superfamily phosphodiesterase
MTIKDLYAKYKIMPNLQQHMFRVTGVAEVMCSHLKMQVDTENILLAGLLHDMGNIIKFKLDYFPEFIQPEGIEFWQKVQDEYRAKYGDNAHHATMKILEEIGVSQRVKELVDAVSFAKSKKNLDSEDFGLKICAYADMRVAPFGVVPLEGRFADGQKRYQQDGKKDTFSYAMNACIRKMEKQLFAQMDIEPDFITDEVVAPLMAKYLEIEI